MTLLDLLFEDPALLTEPVETTEGTFHSVLDPARVADLGTVFLPLNDVHENSITVPGRHQRFPLQLTEEGQYLIPESVVLEVHDEHGDLLWEVPYQHLHGHESWPSTRIHQPRIDIANGMIRDPRRWFTNAATEDGTVTVHFQYTTSPYRWVREEALDGFPEWVEARWFNILPVEGYNNQPHLAWFANAIYNQAWDDNTFLVFDYGTYEYFGPWPVPNKTTYVGKGGTYLGNEEIGYNEQKYRRVYKHEPEAATRFVVPDGEAIRFLATGETDIRNLIRATATNIRHMPHVEFASFQDLQIDGQFDAPENQELWPLIPHSTRETYFRNSPGFNGMNFSNHGMNREDIPFGAFINLDGVSVEGFPANCLLGNARQRWYGRNVYLADSAWNHLLYHNSGDWDNLTLSGYAWGHTAFYSGRVKNLVVIDVKRNPYRSAGGGVFGVRGGDDHSLEERGERNVYVNDGVEIDGFYAEHSEVGGTLFCGIGPEITIRNGTAIDGRQMWHECANGYQRALYGTLILENLDYFVKDRNANHGIGTTNFAKVRGKKLRYSAHPERTTSSGVNRFFNLAPRRRNHYAWDEVDYLDIQYEDVKFSIEAHFLAGIGNPDPDAVPIKAKFTDFEFNNRTSTLVVSSTGQGRIDQLTIDNPEQLGELIQFDWINGSMRWPTNYNRNYQIMMAVSRFHNVTDSMTGNTSEVRRTVHVDAGDSRTVQVRPGLIWVPSYVESPYPYRVLLSNGNEVPTTPINESRHDPIIEFYDLPDGELEFEFFAAVNPIMELIEPTPDPDPDPDPDPEPPEPDMCEEYIQQIADLQDDLTEAFHTVNGLLVLIEDVKQQRDDYVQQLEDLSTQYHLLSLSLQEQIEINNQLHDDLNTLNEENSLLQEQLEDCLAGGGDAGCAEEIAFMQEVLDLLEAENEQLRQNLLACQANAWIPPGQRNR